MNSTAAIRVMWQHETQWQTQMLRAPPYRCSQLADSSITGLLYHLRIGQVERRSAQASTSESRQSIARMPNFMLKIATYFDTSLLASLKDIKSKKFGTRSRGERKRKIASKINMVQVTTHGWALRGHCVKYSLKEGMCKSIKEVSAWGQNAICYTDLNWSCLRVVSTNDFKHDKVLSHLTKCQLEEQSSLHHIQPDYNTVLEPAVIKESVIVERNVEKRGMSPRPNAMRLSETTGQFWISDSCESSRADSVSVLTYIRCFSKNKGKKEVGSTLA